MCGDGKEQDLFLWLENKIHGQNKPPNDELAMSMVGM
jgi:hypothetical protein